VTHTTGPGTLLTNLREDDLHR